MLLRKVRKLAMKMWLYPKYGQVWFGDYFDFLLPVFAKKDLGLELILDVICSSAAQKGFVFTKPKIRVIRKGIGQRLRYWHDNEIVTKKDVCGLASEGRLILIFWNVAHEFTEMELAVIVAHEFGHILDYQTKRKGHPLFDNIRYVDQELFAHAIASYLYSKLVVKTAYERIGIKINDLAFINLNLKA